MKLFHVKRILTVLAVCLAPSLAWSQAAVQQGGSWTSGHVPKYNSTGGTQPLVTDGGGAGGGAVGVNPGTLGITARGTGTPPYDAQGAGPNGENFCMYDAPTTNATGYHSLCLDPNIGGTATISTQASGGAAAQGLDFVIDGVTYDFPEDFPTIPVTVPNGGTGLTSLTDTNLLIGNGTSNVTLLPPSATSGVPLVSQGVGSDPAYGTAVIAGGGTGQTTANAALNALLPDQSGQNGKVLQTDGTDTSWASVPGTGTVTSVASGTGLTGGPITTSGTLSFATVADGSVLANISGGVAAPAANTVSDILDDQIGNGQGSLAMRGAATWGALTPGTTGLPLLSDGPGNDLVFGALSITNLNIAGQSQGDIIYFDGSNWARLGAGEDGQFLQTQGSAANPQWNTAPPGFRNLLIGADASTNPWQRGTSFNSINSTATYTADRWAAYSNNGSASVSVSRESSGLTGFPQAFRIQRASSNSETTDISFSQIIETVNVRPYQGKTLTLSFQARAGADFSAAASALNVNLAYGTGADEGLSSFLAGTWTGYTASNETATLTTNFQEFSYTLSVPSTATELAISFSFTPDGTAGAADYFDLATIQYDAYGATEFESLPEDVVLSRCEYYYQAVSGGTGFSNSTTSVIVGSFYSKMRTTPTLVIGNSAPAFQESGGTTYTGSSSAISIGSIGDGYARMTINGFTGITASRIVVYEGSGGALAFASSEL